MKKLGKLTINPDKVIKNDELVNLKGGEYPSCTCTFTLEDNTTYSMQGLCGVGGNCLACAVSVFEYYRTQMPDLVSVTCE